MANLFSSYSIVIVRLVSFSLYLPMIIEYPDKIWSKKTGIPCVRIKERGRDRSKGKKRKKKGGKSKTAGFIVQFNI